MFSQPAGAIRPGPAPLEERFGVQLALDIAVAAVDARQPWCVRASESDGDDDDEVVEPGEVVGIPSAQREFGCGRYGRDQQVDGARSSGLAASRDDCGVDPPVGPSGGGVERDGVECRFGTLEPVLASSSLGGVACGMWAGCELGHRDRCDGDLAGQSGCVDAFEVDHDRGVEDAAVELMHGGRSRCLPRRRDRRGSGRNRWLGRDGTD